MRKLLFVLWVGFFAFVGIGIVQIVAQGQSPYIFEMTDGYFQAHGAGEPIHLIHTGPYPPQWVYLGEGVHIWYTIAVRQGEKSPCDRRSQTECNGTVSFVSLADPRYSWHIDDGFRIEDPLYVSYGIPIDCEKTPLGAGKFVWTIEKDGKILFSHEILVEVK